MEKKFKFQKLLLATFILNQTKKVRLINTLRIVISLTFFTFVSSVPPVLKLVGAYKRASANQIPF